MWPTSSGSVSKCVQSFPFVFAALMTVELLANELVANELVANLGAAASAHTSSPEARLTHTALHSKMTEVTVADCLKVKFEGSSAAKSMSARRFAV